MDQKHIHILETVRTLALEVGIENVTIDDICAASGIDKIQFYNIFEDDRDLVRKVLKFERDSFNQIFDHHNFEGVNAIKILLTVSKEISSRFKDVNPFVTVALKENYPEIYQEHFNKRTEYIFEKIKINLQKGISQGIYREDLSIELIARLYISRLIDIHNPDLFPPERFNFFTLFEVMFDNFIRGIANTDGLLYYEENKPELSFKPALNE